MCGRFAQFTPIADLAEEYEIAKNLCDLHPRYNISPGMEIAAIIIDQGKKLVKMKWGFIPSWAKESSIGYKMINARAETITEKPSFRTSFKRRRCLIPADGFYEWKTEGDEKIPVYVKLKSGKPFALAGIYDFWKAPDGKLMGTCAIITTEANQLFLPVHNRMPVVINSRDHAVWLDFTQEEQLLLPFLKPFSEDDFDFHEVTRDVNSPKNDNPNLILLETVSNN